jgi:hypothetical protein
MGAGSNWNARVDGCFRRMSHSLKLFVIDTGPLITLAVANALDYLLYVQADIVIPDAVLYEATHDAAKLGAQDIIDWVKVNRARIELAPTQAFAIFEAARENIAKLRQPDLGERAAVEVIEEPDRLTGNERAVLLCEESALLRRIEIRDKERIVELSTMDFLRILETERRIQSADHVFDMVLEAGRNASRVEKLPTHSDATSEAIRALLRRGDEEPYRE